MVVGRLPPAHFAAGNPSRNASSARASMGLRHHLHPHRRAHRPAPRAPRSAVISRAGTAPCKRVQPRDEIQPRHPAAQLVVDQKAVGQDADLLDQRQRLFARWPHPAPTRPISPAAAPSRGADPRRSPPERRSGPAPRAASRRSAAGAIGAPPVGQRHLHHEARPPPQRPRSAPADGPAARRRVRRWPAPAPSPREAEAGAFRRRNSLKMLSCSSSGMPGPVSQTSSRTMPPAPPRPDQHPAPLRIADRVADQVLQDAPQIGRVRRHDRRRGHDPQRQPLAPPPAARTRRAAARSSRSSRTGPTVTAARPLSSFEISSSAARMSSTDTSAFCALSSASRDRASTLSSSIDEMNSFAADRGCSRSWLAAATKRDRRRWRARHGPAHPPVPACAPSRAPPASRSRGSAPSIAARSAVTSVKLITKPRSGISCAKTSRISASPRRTSNDSGARGPRAVDPVAPAARRSCRSPNATSSAEALQQIVEARPHPQPRHRDRQQRRPAARSSPPAAASASKMQTPWLMWSSVARITRA